MGLERTKVKRDKVRDNRGGEGKEKRRREKEGGEERRKVGKVIKVDNKV